VTRLRSEIRRLEICGGIASGKTTLAKLLQRAGFTPVLEQFRRNPFLDAFYADPAHYALETEFSFLLQHFHAIKKSASTQTVRACDFSFVLDHAYARVTLSVKQQRQFETLLRWLLDQIGVAPLFVHLRCPPSIELARIRRRGRDRERGISEQYLANLNYELGGLLRSARSNVFVLDSHELNFASNRRVQKQVLRDLEDFVLQRPSRGT
jgi:deoxyadenosine/deoxycytidine kinase